MPVTVFHAHTATTPDIVGSYDILPQRDWNSAHAATLQVVGTEVSGAFAPGGGGGNVTFGTNAQGFITATAAAGAATATAGIMGIGAGGSTATSGTITVSNANGVSFGLAGNVLTASVATAAAQTGTFAGTSTGFAGTNVSGSLTVNTAGVALALSGPAPGVATGTFAGTSTGFGGTNVSGSITLNTAGLALSLSAASAAAGGVAVSGAGVGGALVSTGTLTLTPGPNITLSQVGNAITISGASQAPATATAGIMGVSAAGAVATSGTLNFVNTNGVSFGLDVNNNLTASVASAAPGGVATATAFAVGNTTLGTSASLPLSSLVVSAQGLVSAGLSGNTLVFSGPATVPGTFLSAGLSALGNTAGATGLANGALVLAGGANITLSGSTNTGGQMTVSISGATVAAVGGVAVSASGNVTGAALISSGTLTLVGGSNISLSQAGNALTINGGAGGPGGGVAVVAGGQTTGTVATVSTGTLTLAGSFGVRMSQSSNAITAYLDAVQTTFFSGNTITASSQTRNLNGGVWAVSGVGGVSVGGTGSTMIISGATGGGAGLSGVQIAGNTSGTAVMAQGTLVLAGGPNVTVSQSSNFITISAAGGTAPTAGTATKFALGNTTVSSSGTQAFASMPISGAGIVSVGMSSNTLVISAPNAASLTPFAAGMSTVGTSGLATQQFLLAGGANISLSSSTSAGAMTVSIIGGAGGPGGGGVAVSAVPATGGNVSGASLVSSGTLVLAAGSFISFNQSSNSITINAPGVTPASTVMGVGGIGVSSAGSTISISNIPVGRTFWPPPAVMQVLNPPANGSLSVMYFPCANAVTASRLDMLMNVGGTSTANAATSAIVISAYAGIYTRGVGAASFGSLYSGSATQSLSGASNNSGALTAWQTQGVRAVSVPLNVTNMTPGDYWVGLMFNTAASSVGSTTTSPQVVIGMMGAPILEVYAPYVDNLTGAVVTAAAGSNVWLQGMYSVTSSALPPSLMASAILQGPPPQQAANANIVLRNW